MAYNDDRQQTRYRGNWTCSMCGGAITDLPFEPDPSRLGELKCSDCHAKSRGTRPARQDRPKVHGNWTCSACGTAITELPFEPRPDRVDSLKCYDCFKKEREAA